jgi:signal transduction histidine kinase
MKRQRIGFRKNIFSIIVGVLTVLTWTGFAQPGFNPDSLELIFQRSQDTHERLESLLQLSEGFLGIDSARTMTYSEKYLKGAKHSKNLDLVREAYELRSYIFDYYNSTDTAVLYCDSAINTAKALNSKTDIARLTLRKGRLLFKKGPADAIHSYLRGYQLYSDLGDSLGMAKAMNGIAVMYMRIPVYDSAIYYFMELINLAERQGYEKLLGMGYVNLGIMFHEKLEPGKAGHYLRKSIEINRIHSKSFEALAYLNLGIVYADLEQYDSAMAEYQKALQIYMDEEDLKSMGDVYSSMGSVYASLADYDSAKYYHTRAKKLYQEVANRFYLAKAYNNIASALISLGEPGKALILLDSCLSMADTNWDLTLLSKIYYNKHRANFTLKRYRPSVENLLLYNEIKDSIFSLEKERFSDELEIQYQVRQKQEQLFELKTENLIKTKQRNAMLYAGVGVILLITFVFLYLRQKVVKDKIIAEQRVKQLEEEKKLLAARSLVEGQEEERKRIARELHDGLGVLLSTTRMQFSTISDKSPENKPLIERASRLLEQASSDVRKISHNMMPGLLTKFGLYEAIEDLFDKISETEGLDVRYDVPEEAERLPENSEIMIYRIVQELVNNTLKHAGAKKIEIQVQVLDDHLDIIYSDDGKGFNVEEKLESKSIGLTSIQSRVNFLNGKMKVQSSPGEGVTFTFQLPVTHNA